MAHFSSAQAVAALTPEHFKARSPSLQAVAEWMSHSSMGASKLKRGAAP